MHSSGTTVTLFGGKMKNVKLLIGVIFTLLVVGCAKERPLEQEHKPVDELSVRGDLPVQFKPGTGQINGNASGSSKFQQHTIVDASQLDRGNDVLYVASSQGVPRTARGFRPYFQNKERVLQLFYEEDAIVGYEMEKDGNFVDNPLNNRPVIKIPVEYRSYRCRENANKECTNIEELNTDADLQWYQKDRVVIDYENVKQLEIDFTGVDSPCYSEDKSELVHHEVNGDMIYFEVKKTLTWKIDNWGCIAWLWDQPRGREWFSRLLDENAAIEITQAFSMLRLNQIASPDYEAINYPNDDHHRFGFFKSVKYFKGPNQDQEMKFFLNRWNPNKNDGVITYWMSREFNKPSNKYLKDATIQAFDQMNKALEHNGVKIRLGLRELTPELETVIRPGDLRYTMVVLIEDLASGLLGYGPSVANPLTGEIVKAHTNMYKGSLELSAPRIYDNLRELEEMELAEAAIKSQRPTAAAAPAATTNGNGAESANFEIRFRDLEKMFNKSELSPLVGIDLNKYSYLSKNLLDNSASENLPNQELLKTINHSSDYGRRLDQFAINDFKNQLKYDRQFTAPKDMDLLFAHLSKKAEEQFKASGENVFDTAFFLNKAGIFGSGAQEIRNHLELQGELARNNVYTTEMINFDSLGKVGIKDIEKVEGIRDENGVLKPWLSLNERQQRQLTEILVTHYYIPTLVHEIGHNLGLRHNFEGSVDQANFYTEAERKKLGIEGAARYSSIMDYNYSSLNALATFGKYDAAALRFAYNREVEVQGGAFVPVESDLLSQFILNATPDTPRMRPYAFCTDENAGTSLTCDRFDEGVDTLEISNHYIERHINRYKYSNLKDRKERFEETDNYRYIIRQFFRLANLRRVHELWQAYYNFLKPFSPTPNPQDNLAITGCTPELQQGAAEFCQELDRVIQSNINVGRFFLDVIKTPQLTCHMKITGTIGEQTVWNGDHMYLPLTTRDLESIEIPLANGKGYTRPSDCFNDGVQRHFETLVSNVLEQNCGSSNPFGMCTQPLNYKVEMVGQTGKPLDDVRAAYRFDQRLYSQDIEIRGYWMEKMIATHFLTHRHNIVSAGGDHHIGYIDHPAFRDEIINLTQHLAYGQPLRGAVKFRGVDGSIYQTPYVDENNKVAPAFNIDMRDRIAVPTYSHEIIDLFLDIPMSNNEVEGFDLAPYMLKQIASSSMAELGDTEQTLATWSATQQFHDFLTVEWTGNTKEDDKFTGSIVAEYSFKDYPTAKVGVTERNGLGLYMINQLSGERQKTNTEIMTIVNALNGPRLPPPTDEVATGGVSADAAEATETTETTEEATTTEETAEATAEAGTKGTELLQTVYGYRALYENFYDEVNTLAYYVQNAQSDQQLNQIIAALQNEWGQRKWGVVLYAYQQMLNPEATPAEVTLRNMNIIDLQYAVADEAGKAELDSLMENGLFNLRQRGRRAFSILFWFKQNREGTAL